MFKKLLQKISNKNRENLHEVYQNLTWNLFLKDQDRKPIITLTGFPTVPRVSETIVFDGSTGKEFYVHKVEYSENGFNVDLIGEIIE